jgi:DNA repair exonuclease SbcCD ATPase subunit
MINEIRLQNYRQHENRTVTFTKGINAIRAANGTGKTKLLESITYCLFGARALAEPLEDVVTRGMPASKLKAEVDLTHMGVQYTFARSKAGAEVRTGEKVLVTGANEVTKFAEQLFGANAEMASKLMIAKQKQLGGALSGGAAKASEMIEFLADFNLFDRIIGLIQTKLPNGATSSVEGRIELLRAQSGEVVLADLQPLTDAATAASAACADAREQVGDLQLKFDTLDITAATSILAQQKQLITNITGRTNPIGALQAALAADLPPAAPAGAIDAVRAKIEAQKGLIVAEKLHAELKAAKVGVLWDQNQESLSAEVAKTEASVAAGRDLITKNGDDIRGVEAKLAQAKSATDVLRAQLQGKLVKEESCSFCGKDLKDVPEVALVNNPLYDQLTELESDWAALQAQTAKDLETLHGVAKSADASLHDARVCLQQLTDVVTASRALDLLYARAADYITLDTSVVPAQWSWTGPTDAPQDFAGELAALEAQDKAATAAAARRAEQQIQLTQQQAAQAADQAALDGLPIADAEETLQLANDLKPQLAAARIALEATADAVHLAEGSLTTARLANENAVKAQTASKEQLAGAEAEMVEMQENNALVKKVRAAKPQVIDQLWAMALAATSRYGSQMRGEQWVVSRADGEFKVNSFPAAGLSGAEEDLLGLSIRVALTKLFLPNTPFMVLDEVAAACDDQRETAMLGLLSTLDFDQIILVTHSEHADSYAQNVITL